MVIDHRIGTHIYKVAIPLSHPRCRQLIVLYAAMQYQQDDVAPLLGLNDIFIRLYDVQRIGSAMAFCSDGKFRLASIDDGYAFVLDGSMERSACFGGSITPPL